MPKTNSDSLTLDAILRIDFPSFVRRCFETLNPGKTFVPNWHIEAIAYQLERIVNEETRRLILNLPPRYLKSTIVTVAWTAFILGHDPTRRILCLSYSDELARKFTSDFRAIVQSRWYRKLFPRMRIKRATDSEIETTLRGYRKATTIYGSVMGFGGELIVIDDPQKPVDVQSQVLRDKLNRTVSDTLLTRLDNHETGAVVLVMQRLHADDLTGHLLAGKIPWAVLKLPAIALERQRIPLGGGRFYIREKDQVLSKHQDSLAAMLRLREEIGANVFSTQFQQSPIPVGGKIVKRESISYYDELPQRHSADRILQSWDTSAKPGTNNAWSVCMTFFVSNGTYYLIDRWRGQVEYPALFDKADALATQHKPSRILIEDASTGIPLAQALRQQGKFPVVAIPVERDKEARLYAVLLKFEQRKVLFKRNAPYLHELEEELLSFPESKTTDQVDSITQALAYEFSSYDSTMSWVGGDDDDGRFTIGDYLFAMRSRGLI